ncbi:MAG: protein arginine kinase [Candidatus Omnitrophica bacterium]|nr:protein arginine kinase [Candidatus Omnitrophota bacterium]
MKIDDLLEQPSEWLKGTGPQSEIVLSSRIRLARNLDHYPFSHWADKKQEEEVLEKVKKTFLTSPYLKGALFLKLGDLTSTDKQFLIERHLISREHAVNVDHKAVCMTPNEMISIMVNEEDHLRIQVLQSGFDLMEVWRVADTIDDSLSEHLTYAFSTNWGYLTCCPTNTGTGLRASVMLHLPALVMTKQINKVIQMITKLHLTARGFYGEGTQASGNLFQISNQVTLGHTEIEIIDNIERIIRQVIEYEQGARKTLMTQEKAELQDRIFRAYGTLKNAHIITSNETIDLISMVRLGVDMGLIKDLNRELLNELFIVTQPAHLQKLEGKTLSASQRDLKRATIIRGKLSKQ